MLTNMNNKNAWLWNFDRDKNISLVVASLLKGHYEYNYSINKWDIDIICSVNNINKTQAKKAIKIALNYVQQKDSN